MNAPALRLQVGACGPTLAGFLRVGADADADVALNPAEELPLEDGSFDTILVGALPPGVAEGARLNLLIECRRVLRPGGDIRLPDAMHALADLVGLEPATNAHGAGDDTPRGMAHERWTKPDRTLCGDPLVSIAIPAYNPRFFGVCLDSALSQLYEPLDIVVCDDSSGPEIEAMVAERRHRRPIRYARNPERLRPRGNFLRAFSLARGEFVKFLCDDDLLAPRCVAELLDAFRRAPDVTLATSRRRRIGERGEPLPDLPATTPIVGADTLIAGHTLANAMLLAGLNTLGEPSTVLFRKREFPDAATHDFHFRGETGHGVIDMVMWTSLLMKGNAVYRSAALSSFRSHPGQRQHDPARQARNVESIRRLQQAWLALGLGPLHRPDAILARPLPPSDADWRRQSLLGFAARPVVAGAGTTRGDASLQAVRSAPFG